MLGVLESGADGTGFKQSKQPFILFENLTNSITKKRSSNLVCKSTTCFLPTTLVLEKRIFIYR